MDEFWIILGYAAMPAAGNFLGGVLAEMFNVTEKTLSLALHMAAGIVLAVIGIELVPQALAADPPYIPIQAFVAGSVFFVLLDKSIGYVQSRFGGEGKTGLTSAIAIYIGVSVDLFSDGVMIGTGSTVAASLGLLLAIGQVPADSQPPLPRSRPREWAGRNGCSSRLPWLSLFSWAPPSGIGA
ncbi:ZIP family metal transporter [Rufibacter immobilis]|uniref:ZIP family metal transporter n=1 Tax=Rufibacter immobilis TaxID=1348778 RepID=UPI0035E5C89A